jgi:poly(A) polymerase
MRQSTLKKFLRLEGFEEHLELHRVDCLSSHRNLENYEIVYRAWKSLPAEVIRPPRLLTGHDLIAAGYVPGPQFQKILEAVEEAQLESSVASREDALALVRRRFPALPEEPPAS